MADDVGEIAGIYRYPVKSMLGGSLERTRLERDGLPGDRAWGVRDERRGDFFVGKRSGALMACRARYVDGFRSAGEVPEIVLPDGATFRADARDAGRRVGELVGHEVSLWAASPEARSVEPSGEGSLDDDLVTMMARLPGEPMPDFSDPPKALLEVYARGGPFFDAYPLLLLSERSIATISDAAEDSRIDVRRFRPNLLVRTKSDEAFPEQAWIGRRLRVGDAIVEVHAGCDRCVMTTHGFADLPKDPRVMRALVRENAGRLGVYATVLQTGGVESGARVRTV